MRIPATTIVVVFTLACACLSACRDAASPSASASVDAGASGSMTPPGDYASTGRGGLGEPVNNVGTDGGNMPSVYKDR